MGVEGSEGWARKDGRRRPFSCWEAAAFGEGNRDQPWTPWEAGSKEL
jgi:hypothetical protein